MLTSTGFIFSDARENAEPKNLYQVYLDGEVIGVIESRDELLDLIDREQTFLKNKYGVDKVYPPKGLEIRRVITYNGDVDSVNSIYEKIKDNRINYLKFE